MEYQIKLKPSAEKDIEDITDYYFAISENLGLRFYFEFKESIENLKIYPKFQLRYRNVRCIYLDSFPYLIHFQVSEELKEILFIAVLHTSRDPKIWWKTI